MRLKYCSFTCVYTDRWHMVVMFTMECSNNKRRSTDPVQPSCPHFSSGAGCTSIHRTMSSTQCFFSVSQIISFFRFGHVKRRNKVMNGIGGNNAKSRKTADKISRITSKPKSGKVQKRTYEKKDQEKVNCDPAKLGTTRFTLCHLLSVCS